MCVCSLAAPVSKLKKRSTARRPRLKRPDDCSAIARIPVGIALALKRGHWHDFLPRCGGRRHRSIRMRNMGPPFRQADCGGPEADPVPSSSKRRKIEDNNAISMMRVGGKVSHYNDVSA